MNALHLTMAGRRALFSGFVAVTALTVLRPVTLSAQPPANPLNQPATIYWCPDRPADQQISAEPELGCAPLVETQQKPAGPGSRQKTLVPLKMERIQTEASEFLRRYNEFLECCADDVAELDRILDLEAEASNILTSIQTSGIYNTGMAVRQFTLGEIVRQVAQSRRDLKALHARLESIGKRMDRLEGTDPEISARERWQLEADREALSRDFRPKRPPGSARTGVDIQDTSLPNRYGEDLSEPTTLRNATGTEIGTVASPHSDQSSALRPRPGPDVRDTTLSERNGPATQETTLPNSTGFGIGTPRDSGQSPTTGIRVGPDIGDSTLNR